MTKIMFRDKECEADYLGDGVYAIRYGLGIWLHANHHENPTDRIFLEPKVFEALIRFKKRMELFEKDNQS